MAEFKKNQEIALIIEDFTKDGEGLGKIQGFPFFVKDTVIGDRIIAAVTKLKKNYGYARLVSILEQLRAHHLEPKRLRLVHPYVDKEPTMVLVEAVRGGREELRIAPPLIIYQKPEVYTEEILRIYSEEGK